MSTTANAPVTACVLIIGNEILSGRTQDANLSFLAKALNDIGIRVTEARVIADDEATIVATVNDCRRRFGYVFTTGGIGPTHDDITAAAIAKAFGVPLRRDPEAERRLSAHYKPEDRNPARMKMADIPEGGVLIDNPVSSAPGFQLDNVFVLPGVPVIMRAMFDGVRPRLVGGPPVLSRIISAFTTEGAIAKPLGEIQAVEPAVEIGSYPFARHGRFGTSLVARSTDRAGLDRAGDAILGMLRELGIEPYEDIAAQPSV